MDKAASRAASHRVFFALWPDAAAARALADAATAPPGNCVGRYPPPEALHMTLAFIGKVGAAQLAMLEDIARQVSAPPFPVVLDRMVWWRKRHIVWAGAARLPDALKELVRDLASRLLSAGFATQARPFVAHVTLLRNARCGGVARLPAPIYWPVSEFLLVESLLRPPGASYRSLGRYPLQPIFLS